MKNVEILDEKKISNHPDDWYLSIVLARKPHEYMEDGFEYVTWLKNVSRDEPSYNNGHYYGNYVDALLDFVNRN